MTAKDTVYFIGMTATVLAIFFIRRARFRLSASSGESAGRPPCGIASPGTPGVKSFAPKAYVREIKMKGELWYLAEALGGPQDAMVEEWKESLQSQEVLEAATSPQAAV